MPSLHRTSAKDKARALRQRIDVSLDTLAKAVDDVRASETFREYLAVQAKFHRYSWHNSMLILCQRPDASRVAGFRAWKKLGRHVCKGERGIMIFAPCPYHRETDDETIDGVYFKAVHVFDVSQTDGSGGKPLGQRDGGARLLQSLQGRKGDAVVMLKLDRGFRNATDCLATVEQWERKSTALHVIDLGGNAIDTTSVAGRFMLVVLAGAAEMERNLTRERTKAALAVKKSNGQRVGTVPYGYDLDADSVALIPNDTEQVIIADIRAMRATGKTLKAIAETLTKQGVPTKNGKRRWSHSTIAQILSRE